MRYSYPRISGVEAILWVPPTWFPHVHGRGVFAHAIVNAHTNKLKTALVSYKTAVCVYGPKYQYVGLGVTGYRE
jgi:hypothetical protein